MEIIIGKKQKRKIVWKSLDIDISMNLSKILITTHKMKNSKLQE